MLYVQHTTSKKFCNASDDISDSQFGGKGDDGEALPGGEALLPVDEERVGLDLEVVLQAALVHQQVLWTCICQDK